MAKKVSEAQLHITGKDRTKTAFNSVQGRLKRMKDSMTGMKGAMTLLSVASVGVFAKMAKDAANTADEIRKMSGRIGITTDALQEMRFAFGLAGVEGDVLNKGLLNFSKALGEARVGTGALTTFLNKSNKELLFQLINSQNNTQALNIFIDALSRTANASDKTALASAAMGRAGKLMTTAFENGADAFAGMREEAHRLGLVIDQELLENAEAMNDQLSIVTQVVKIHLTKAFLELAPEITRSAKALTEFLVGLKSLNDGLILTTNSQLSVTERIIRGIGFALDVAGKELANLLGLPGLAKIFDERALKAVDALRKGKPLIGTDENPLVLEMQKRTPSLPSKTTGAAAKAGIPLVDPHDLSQILDTEKKLDKMFEDMRVKEKARLDLVEKTATEFEHNIADQVEMLKAKLKGDELEVKILEEKLALEKQLGRELITDPYPLDGEDMLFGETTNELEVVRLLVAEREKLNKQLERQNELASLGERVFDRMGDGLIFSLQRGADAFESLKNTAVAALFDIQREIIKLMVFEPLKKTLFNFAGSFFGGGRASGGAVKAGTSYLVGERGAEMFTPTRDGYITPNNQLGGGVNVTLNFTTGIQSTVRAEIMGLMPVISENVKQAVADARQRGGSFSTAMGV